MRAPSYVMKPAFRKKLAPSLNLGTELYLNRVGRAAHLSVRVSARLGQGPAGSLGERACTAAAKRCFSCRLANRSSRIPRITYLNYRTFGAF